MKVDALEITGKGAQGETITGLECGECGQEFFDSMSEEAPPRIVESAIAKFIEHADQEHHSTGGVIGGKRRDEWRACA